MYKKNAFSRFFICVIVPFLFAACVTPPSTDVIRPDAEIQASSRLAPELQEYFGSRVAENILSAFNRGSPRTVLTDEEKQLSGLALRLSAGAEYGGRLSAPGQITVRILETDEFNSMSSGNGVILITRALINSAGTEAMRAAVIAHEIAHLTLGHPLAPVDETVIRGFTGGSYTSLAADALENPELKAALDRMLQDSLELLMNTGYGSKAEYKADAAAVRLLSRTGFDPSSLTSLLARLETRLDPSRPDMAATHPAPARRLAALTE